MPEFKGTKYEGGYPTREYEKYLESIGHSSFVIIHANALPEELLTESNYRGNYKGTAMTLVVYGSEGYKPHMHVFMGEDRDDAPVACVRLDVAEYFDHGKKSDRFVKLNSFYKKALISILKGPLDDKDRNSISVWKFMCYSWNASNQERRMENINMPDYSKLE